MIDGYYLGCPIWSNKAWVGELFTLDAKASDFLRQYGRVFNTVEGNTSFYAVPPVNSVAAWADQAPADFRFCFKIPRAITHDRRLQNAEAESELFFQRMAPLGERLGPFLVQLPPSLGPQEWPVLTSFLVRLPPQYRYAVEVRHPDFFGAGEAEARLDQFLQDLGMDRVLFDSRPLRAADRSDPNVRRAQQRKPDLPVHPVALGPHPLVRYIADPNLPANDPWLREWAQRVAAWIEAGRQPFVFLHAPDDFYAPRLARRFHQLLSDHVDVGRLPPWPADEAPSSAEQLSLF
ncbi:MAG: DUF72 domain-containing protein [Anaerolineales bacterium]|nr:DUF72 domain-containing protein [Anaerolineales bacterium]MCB9127699.1 DUF72 domain-containing protein [Ardenticatenales bacterium]